MKSLINDDVIIISCTIGLTLYKFNPSSVLMESNIDDYELMITICYVFQW